MLTDRESFKFGFLLRCAEEGLTSEQTRDRVKQAAAFSKQGDGLIMPGLKALPGLGMGLLAGGALLSAGAGAGAGLMAAKATEPDAAPDEIQAQEQIAAYRLYADQIRQRNALRQIREQTLANRKPSFQFQ